MPFELMDLATANLIGSYETEAEALAEVATMVHAHGPASVASWGLGFDDFPASAGFAIADGEVLAARALTHEAAALTDPMTVLVDGQEVTIYVDAGAALVMEDLELATRAAAHTQFVAAVDLARRFGYDLPELTKAA